MYVCIYMYVDVYSCIIFVMHMEIKQIRYTTCLNWKDGEFNYN